MEKHVYRGGFDSWKELASDFDITLPEPECVWAEYDNGGYDGSALVVYKTDGIWYQVYGSHCSCYGLEDQFEPEVLDLNLHFEALKEGKSLIAGYGMDSVELNEWLKANS